MSWVGRPTAVRIRSIVTRPALGILAAPTLARVAVRLDGNKAKRHSVTLSRASKPNQISTHNYSDTMHLKWVQRTAINEDIQSLQYLYKEQLKSTRLLVLHCKLREVKWERWDV